MATEQETPPAEPEDFKEIAEQVQGGPAPAEDAVDPSLTFLSEAGFDTTGWTRDEAKSAIEAMYDRSTKADEYEQQLAQASQYVNSPEFNEFKAWQAEQSKSKAPEAEPAAPKFQPPVYQDEWLQRAKRHPDTGRFVPISWADQAAADGLNKYEDEKAVFDKRLLSDLPGLLRDMGIIDSLKAEVAKEHEPLKAKLQQYEEDRARQQSEANQARLRSFLADNGKHLFQFNEQGQQITNPDGSPVLTQLGQYGSTLYDNLVAANVPEEVARQQMIIALTKFIPEPAQEQPVPSQGTPTRNEKGQFLPKAPVEPEKPLKKTFAQLASGQRLPAGVGHSASRNGGGAPDQEELSNDATEIARNEMRKRGWNIG